MWCRRTMIIGRMTWIKCDTSRGSYARLLNVCSFFAIAFLLCCIMAVHCTVLCEACVTLGEMGSQGANRFPTEVGTIITGDP